MASPIDFKEAGRLGELGIALVDSNANELWKSYALDAIFDTALLYKFFIVDQVWETFQRMRPGVWNQVHNKAAMGPRLRVARALGWIQPTGETRMSGLPGHHLSKDVPVWESLIY
jgi:hypothetical protein